MITDRIGQQIGNYRLVRLLGTGGRASVYLGEHRYLRRSVVIKVFHTRKREPDVERFFTEAQLLSSLSHPHMVRVLEFAVEQDTPFIVMEYVSGGSLRSFYPAGSCLFPTMVAAALKQVAAALQYAHDHYVIHGAIRPENFFFNAQQEILLSDFRISPLAPSAELLSTQEIMRTLPYMAPEQLRGKPCFASDQYALGIVAYEWLCGHPPFVGTPGEMMAHHLSSPPPGLCEQLPFLPQPLEKVIFKALAKDPERRYESVTAFAQALEEACQQEYLAQQDVSHAPVVLPVTPLPVHTDLKTILAPFSQSENTVRFSPLTMLTYGLANAVIGICSIAVNTVLLPLQVAAMVPKGDETGAFSLVVGIGALASVIANPTIGALIDRSSSSWRSQRWLLAGGLSIALGFCFLGWGSRLPLLVIGSLLSQFGVGSIQAALSSLLPRISSSQRATISALSGMAPVVGGVIGQALVSSGHTIPLFSYVILLGVSVLFLALFLFKWRDTPLAGFSLQVRRPNAGRLLTVWTHRNFTLTWLARFFLFLSYTTTVNYLAFFLLEAVHYPVVSEGVQRFFLVSVLSLLVVSLFTGYVSDKLQRRKPFVIVACLVVALALTLLGLNSSWPVVLGLACLLGIGMGGYLSSDLALAAQVLPNQEDSARDLGIMNAAVSLPMLVAPVIAEGILSQFHHSYAIFFGILALFSVFSSLLMFGVRVK
jgi:serine/threonine protein kinase